MHNPNFRELTVWQLSMNLTKSVYKLMRTHPTFEEYGLRDQIRRAAISIPSNIAEGAGRSSSKEFIHFLYIAQGSLFELDTQLEISRDLNYIDNESYNSLNDNLIHLKLSLSKLISYHKNKLK